MLVYIETETSKGLRRTSTDDPSILEDVFESFRKIHGVKVMREATQADIDSVREIGRGISPT